MKKLFVWVVLCFLVTNALGMKERGISEELTLRIAAAHKLRQTLSTEALQDLSFELGALGSHDFCPELYCAIQNVLDRGADPDRAMLTCSRYIGLVYCPPWEVSSLGLAATKKYGEKIVELLLDYGANPILQVGMSKGVPLIACKQCDFETARLLVHKGVDINSVAAPGKKTLLLNLCSDTVFENELLFLIWALGHEADPNVMEKIGHCESGEIFSFAIKEVLWNQPPYKNSFKKLIALLMFGARLDVAAAAWQQPLAQAEEHSADDRHTNSAHTDYLCAQYELLKALSALKKQVARNEFVREVHSIDEYAVRHISEKSAKLIQEATAEVLVAQAQIDLENFVSQQGNVARFALDRELGMGRRRKK